MQGVKLVKGVAEKLGRIQKQHIKDFVVADYVAEFKFGLVEVVFEWARGMVSSLILAFFMVCNLFYQTFKTICCENIFVRTFENTL